MAKTRGPKPSSAKKHRSGVQRSQQMKREKPKSKGNSSKQQINPPRRSSRLTPVAKDLTADSSNPFDVSSESETLSSSSSQQEELPSSSSPQHPEPSIPSPSAPDITAASPPDLEATVPPSVRSHLPSPDLESSGRFIRGGQLLFDSCFSRRPVTLERQVDFTHFTSDFAFIHDIFATRGWIRMGDIQGNASIDLVREFYTNFHNISPDHACFDTVVRGRVLHITAVFLSSFLRISRSPESTYPNIDWTVFSPLSELVVPMRDNPHPWFPGMLFRQSDLSIPYRVLNLICDSLISPINRSSEISAEKIKLLYCLTQGISIDLPSLIIRSMISAHIQHNSRLALPYGVLITNFLRDHFAIVKDLDETTLSQDASINRATIKRSTAQKQPVQSSSGDIRSNNQPSSDHLSNLAANIRGPGDPMSVVIYTLTSFTDRLTRLEQSNQDLQTSIHDRFHKLEELARLNVDSFQMTLLTPLQEAASSATSIARQMEAIVSSVKDLIHPTQPQFSAISDQLMSIGADISGLHCTFSRLEDLCCRHTSRP